MTRLIPAFCAGLATLATTTPAQAQLAVRLACYSDMQQLCPVEFAARDQDKMRVCLRANLAKASESCQNAVRAQIAVRKPN